MYYLSNEELIVSKSALLLVGTCGSAITYLLLHALQPPSSCQLLHGRSRSVMAGVKQLRDDVL